MNTGKAVREAEKRNVHIIRTVRFFHKRNDGPLECSCGTQMRASEFKDHRKTVAADLGTTQSDLAEHQTVWRRTSAVTPKREMPSKKAPPKAGV